MKRDIFILLMLLILLAFSEASAKTIRDRDNKHFEFFTSIGRSNYFHKMHTSEGGYGISVGGIYSIFNDDNWGFGTGLILSHHNSSISLDGHETSTATIDSEGDNFNLIATFSDFNEDVKNNYIQVPLTLKYRHYISKQFGLIPEIGLNLYSSLGTTSSIKSGSFSALGEYKQFGDYTLIDGIPGAGNYTVNTEMKNYNWHLGVSAMANLQAFFVINKNTLFTTGLSFDYQISPNTGEDNTALVNYEVTSYKTATCHYNPILNSKDAGNFRKSFVGIKVGIIYKWY